MLFFPLYAIAVWLLIAKWRRTWRGFFALLAGIAGVGLLTFFYRQVGIWFHNELPIHGLMALLIGTGALVGVVGAYILVLPIRRTTGHCPWCGYDLGGHEEDEPQCPECGKVAERPKSLKPVEKPAGDAR